MLEKSQLFAENHREPVQPSLNFLQIFVPPRDKKTPNFFIEILVENINDLLYTNLKKVREFKNFV